MDADLGAGMWDSNVDKPAHRSSSLDDLSVTLTGPLFPFLNIYYKLGGTKHKMNPLYADLTFYFNTKKHLSKESCIYHEP